MRLWHRSVLNGLTLAAVLAPASLSAAEYNGRAMFGYLSSQERTKEPTADGSTSNDQQAALGQMYLDVTGVGPFRNEFTLDFRDKYDYFGQVDKERLVLIEANEPQLHELAVKYPYETGSFAWSLGRFPIADAGVVGNDGAEIGYKFTRNMRVGLFGGLIPHNAVHEEKNLEPDVDSKQGGIYAVYQSTGREWWDNTYFANAFVAEQTLEEPLAPGATLETNAQGTPVIPEIPTDPNLEANEEAPKETVNAVHYYSNLVYQPSKAMRFTALAYLYLTPKAYLRSGNVSVWRQITPNLQGNVGVMRIDLTEYRRTRDFRENLLPSEYTAARADVKQKLSRNVAAIGKVGYGVRGIDGLNKMEGAAGLQTSQLFGKHMGASLLAGYRSNFQSKDTFVKATGDLYFKRFDMSVDQQVIVENRDDGETLHPSITGVTLGMLLGNSLLASIGAEVARDERATVTSGLFTIGYRFNSKQLTPVREKAPPVEGLPPETMPVPM